MVTTRASESKEQLAQLIQQGRDDLIPELWDRVWRLVYSLADREFRARAQQFSRCGVTPEDLKQACFEGVFLKAVGDFDPGGGLRFTTYFRYPLRHTADTLTSTVNGRVNNVPLDNCVSLDEPVNAPDEGERYTLLDLLTDMSESTLDQMTEEERRLMIRQAVYSLPEPYHTVISQHFFSGWTYQLIGEGMSLSGERVRQLCQKGLRLLREDENIRQLHSFYSCRKG